MLRCIHSTWSAYTFGVDTSTVAGKFKITLLVGDASQISVTASQTSLATSNSVAVKHSGLYWNTHSVSGCFAAYSFTLLAALIANCLAPSTSTFKTLLRKVGELAL